MADTNATFTVNAIEENALSYNQMLNLFEFVQEWRDNGNVLSYATPNVLTEEADNFASQHNYTFNAMQTTVLCNVMYCYMVAICANNIVDDLMDDGFARINTVHIATTVA